MNLIEPNIHYETSYLDYIEELGDEERYPFPLDFDHADFVKMLKRISEFAEGKNLPQGFVPSSTLWLVEDDQLIGVTNLRHYLNEKTTYCGGHIGIGIRPSFRDKGLGKYLMKLSIQALLNKGVTAIHIHCHKRNKASAKCITDNGGVFHSEVSVNEDIVQRFLVK